MNTSFLFDIAPSFTREVRDNSVEIHAFTPHGFTEWVIEQPDFCQAQIRQNGFAGKSGEYAAVHDKNGTITEILVGLGDAPSLYDGLAGAPAYIQKTFSDALLDETSFSLDIYGNFPRQTAILGWALGCYNFTQYKKPARPTPQLYLPETEDITRTKAFIRAITLLRNMVNMPANDLGPAQIEMVASELAAVHKAKIKVVKGSAIEKEFPLVNAVGQAAIKERGPRLIDISWGSNKDLPVLAIVGKGVCFDTGGLDLKPSQFMRFMKKDMGGAAHALALADLVMALNLPVNLRVIIPAVENAVGANSFRPGDVFTSRKGLTVENTDTDAEGRLILADALAYAAEQSPDLIIDFATLTGSARAALGMDIPATFTNDAELEDHLRSIPQSVHDPLWPMPLHREYRSILKSDLADLVNHAGVPGDLMYSAIFLEHFIGDDNPAKWIHVDCFAWEQSGRPGRPKGGKDTGLRGIFALLEKLYA